MADARRNGYVTERMAAGTGGMEGMVSVRVDGDTVRRSAARRRLAVWLIPFFFWSLPALLTTKVLMEQRDLTFAEAFMSEGIGWMLWALVTPAILAFVRRLPIDRPPHRARNTAIHLVMAVALGVGMGVVIETARKVTGVVTDEVGLGIVHFIVVWGAFGLLFYAAVAAVGLALDYHRRLRERELAASRLESQLIEARLNALRVQLQPHFLFNALNSVSMLVRQGDAATAVRMVARLSDLLRYVLDGGSESMVPLRDEVDFVRQYLDIEQLRFRDRLRVEIDVEDVVQDCEVPGLLLQPLAENAVRHAAAIRAAPTRIEVTARAVHGRLEVLIRDDGPGLPDGFDEAEVSGIGLANTRSRLAWTYGGDAGLSIGAASGGGTEVRLDLPFRRAGGTRD